MIILFILSRFIYSKGEQQKILISCHIDTTLGHLAIKIGCPPVTLQIHSMPNIDLPPRAKSHITAIMCTKEPNIVLEFVQVKEQHGY